MAEGGRADEKVEVTDALAQASQPAALAPENARGLFVDSEQADAAQKISEAFLCFARIARIVNAFGKFRDRDHRYRNGVRLEILNMGDDIRSPVQIMNDPVGIDQIATDQTRGDGRVTM